MKRLLILLYGTLVYALFLGVFIHIMLFIQGAFIPRTMDVGPEASPAVAASITVAVLSAFGLQHTIMARPAFKRWWTKIIHPAVERSTFVLVTITLLEVLIWTSRPIPHVIWEVTGPAANALTIASWIGWGVVLIATFVIDHFELFGLKQVIRHFRGIEHADPEFRIASMYRWTRHPIYLGFVIAFWATPVMTAGHLLFAVVCTAYIFFGVQLEERDLIAAHGESYREYRRRVPMLFPFTSRGRGKVTAEAVGSETRRD